MLSLRRICTQALRCALALSWLGLMSALPCMQCVVTKRRLTRMECSAIALVVLGVVMATVTDSTVMTNMLGCILSGAAILFSAVYQVCSALHASTLAAQGAQHTRRRVKLREARQRSCVACIRQIPLQHAQGHVMPRDTSCCLSAALAQDCRRTDAASHPGTIALQAADC